MKQRYITKYALTRGILLLNGEIEDFSDGTPCFTYEDGSGYKTYFAAKHYYETLDEANARAEQMILNKIRNLNMQITKLHNLDIKLIK